MVSVIGVMMLSDEDAFFFVLERLESCLFAFSWTHPLYSSRKKKRDPGTYQMHHFLKK